MSERGKQISLDSIGGQNPHKCDNQRFHNALQVFVTAASLEAAVRASEGENINHYADVVAEQFPQLEIIPRGGRRARRKTLPGRPTQ